VINVSGLCPARLLQALQNNARPGSQADRGPMTLAEALEYIVHSALIVNATELHMAFRWDYVYGRPIKVVIDNDGQLTREELYDRDAPGGPGTCKKIVEELRRDPSARDIDTAMKEWRRMRGEEST
jgi:hypothetical protein